MANLTQLIFLFFVINSFQPLERFAVSPSVDGRVDDKCLDKVNLLTKEDDWYEQLVNPLLITKAQVFEQLNTYTEIYNCLDQYDGKLSADLEIIHTFTKYFLVFAGGYQTQSNESYLSLVSLATSDDPAVMQMRDETGIKPPDGYIFVRFYSSREAMPDIVKRAFSKEGIVGVTIFMRYIAVLSTKESDWQQQALQFQALPKTISHELIHAYLNSFLGMKNLDALPKWYSEGLAIYYSRSCENNTIVSPNFTISTTSPANYKQYNLNFKYLETKLGRKHLLELIKQSIEKVSPSILYQELHITDEQELASNALAWKTQQDNLKIGLGIVIVLLLGFGLWRLMPEFRCENCGYNGMKKDLIPVLNNLHCPNCHHLIMKT